MTCRLLVGHSCKILANILTFTGTDINKQTNKQTNRINTVWRKAINESVDFKSITDNHVFYMFPEKAPVEDDLAAPAAGPTSAGMLQMLA